MSSFPRAVFFDVDGVLVDSLPQHLQICRDKSIEFGLDIRIPTVEEFRDLVRRGTKVSPMRYFFLAVGFPEDLAERAVADYDRDFVQRYRPRTFPGVERMMERDAISKRTKEALAAAKARGVKLGNPRLAEAIAATNAARTGAADRFAANVRPIIREIQKSGVSSLRGVAKALSARGVKTARGGEWTAVQVSDILRRE
jgi:beta-phosphoglucomutase-like phosphatase (HAD superfamily)